MAEELQSLLDRIQKDGVEKARAEAEEILSVARTEADAIMKSAREEADGMRQKAEADAEATLERGKKTLEQAARDLVLTVGEALGRVLNGIVRREVAAAMTPEVLQSMLIQIVEAYCRGDSEHSGVEVVLNPEQQKQLADFALSKFAGEMRGGLEIKADDGVLSGFRVRIENEAVEHDFTETAVAEALSGLLRPHLAEIVREALGKRQDAEA
jgi:V/A-type H+-transporting ATPase subunit E